MCFGSRNEKETLTLGNRTLLEGDLLLRCFVPYWLGEKYGVS